MPLKSASSIITRPLDALGPEIHPGHILRDLFLSKRHLSQDQLADRLAMNRVSLNRILNGRSGITADVALRLATFLKTTPHVWLNLQMTWDLHQAVKRAARKAS